MIAEAEPAGLGHKPWLSPWHVLLAAPWVLVVIAARSVFGDNGFLWHVRAGDAQIAAGSVLTRDPFSFTRLGQPWRTQSWLPELGYRWLEQRTELGFVGPMLVIVGSTLMVLMGLALWRRLRGAFAVGIALFVSAWLFTPFMNPRPVLLSYVLFALLVVVEADRRLRWSIPLVMWVWAATHATFVVGGVYLVLQAIRRGRLGRSGQLAGGNLPGLNSAQTLLELAVAGGVTLLTAHGWGVMDILLDFLSGDEGLAVINEWASPNLLSIPLWPMAVGLIALMVAAIRGNMFSRDLVVVIPFLLLALDANRSVPTAWIALLPFMAGSLTGIDVGRVPTSGVHRANILATGVVLLIPFLVPVTGGWDEERFPLEAAEHLTAGRVFHDDGAGGYLIYKAWPERQVFVDDRAELFGPLLAESVQMRDGKPGWQETLDEFGIEQALLRDDDPLAEILALSGWSEKYRDENFVILNRP